MCPGRRSLSRQSWNQTGFFFNAETQRAQRKRREDKRVFYRLFLCIFLCVLCVSAFEYSGSIRRGVRCQQREPLGSVAASALTHGRGSDWGSSRVGLRLVVDSATARARKG